MPLMQELVPTVFGSAGQFALACLVMLFVQAIYVLFGFGSGLLALGLLAFLFPSVQDIVVVILLVSLPLELAIAWTARRQIAWRQVWLAGAGVLAGVPLGTWLLRIGRPEALLAALAAFLVATGVTFVLLPAALRVSWPRGSATVAGLLGGILSGVFGTGGPPLIVYYRLAGAGKAVFRSNLMAIWLIVSLVRIPTYAVADLLTRPRCWSALLLLPAVLAGGWIGHRIHVQISERTFQRAVAIALALIGVILLFRHSWTGA